MIYHILNVNEWEESKSKKFYEPLSYSIEGFIHCSALDKIEESANRFFRGKYEIVILCIDEERVKAEIIYEDLYNTGFEFPHIYGQLNLDSVVEVVKIKSKENGEFEFAELLK